MNYYLDLKSKSLEGFKERLANSKLLPSQQILKEKLDERFAAFGKLGIKNLCDLQQSLKDKDTIQRFSEQTGMPADYLTILRREVNSYHPQSRKIADFPLIRPEIKEKLKAIGIKDTFKLYDRIATRKKRKKLMHELGISRDDSLLLAKITDFSRIRYVNNTFATLLMNSNYDTVEKIQKADYSIFCEHLNALNKNKKYFKANFGTADIELLIEDAKYISSGVEF